jgi:pimeloyl-ACP methyl ester carboxylesterase
VPQGTGPKAGPHDSYDAAASTAVPTLGPGPAGTPAISWDTPCPTPPTDPGTALERCGTVTVPLDYAHPAGPTLRIGISKINATGTAKERRGALVVNFGGPGAASVGSVSRLAGQLPDPLRRAYDVIGFDLRGRGTSTRITCTDVDSFRRLKPDTTRLDATGTQAMTDAARTLADGCRRDGAVLLPHLTTRNIARDLDRVRAALGEPETNLLGYSYGTYLAAVYARLFPARVGRMLLDGAVDPTHVWYGTGQGQAPVFHRRWRDWARWTAEHDDSYHLGTTTAQVLDSWTAGRKALAAHPDAETFGGTELDLATLSHLYSDRMWPALSEALAAYRTDEDAAPLRALDGPPGPDDVNFDSVFQTVTCADAPAPADPEVYRQDGKRLLDAYGPLGATIASPGACLHLQTNTEAPLDFSEPPSPDQGPSPNLPGILIINGTEDPATPYAGALRMHAALPSSRLLTVTGSGDHGLFLRAGPCVDDAGTRYLLDGTLPEEDLPGADATCPAPGPGPGA